MSTKLCPVLFRYSLVLLFVAACAGPLRAQRALTMTTADAAAKARAVAAVKVLDVDVRTEGGNIYTFVEFQTITVAKGDVPAQFTYRRIGGRLGNVEVRGGEEVPTFTAGEEVVLFFGPEFSSDGYPTIFHRQVYRVTTRSGTKYISPAATGFAAADLPGGPVNPSAATRLDDLLNAVKKAQ